MKAKSNICMSCKAKTDSANEYSCGAHLCNTCLNNLKENGDKSFQCSVCSVRHLVNKRSNTSSLRTTQEKKTRKPRGRWVFVGKPSTIEQAVSASKTVASKTTASKATTSKAATSKAATSKAATSKATTSKAATSKAVASKATTTKAKAAKVAANVESNEYETKPFDYKRCCPTPNVMQPTKKFNIESVNKDTKKTLRLYSIFEDKILLEKDNTFFLLNQNNEVVKTFKLKQPGQIFTLCYNSKFIYTMSFEIDKDKNKDKDKDEDEDEDESDEDSLNFGGDSDSDDDNEVFVHQYDHEFNFIRAIQLDSACHGFACTETNIYYTTVFGNKWNPHPIIYTLDANNLKLLDSIGYEYEEEKRYCCEKLSYPPQVKAFNDEVYFLYQDCDRIDIMEDETYKYQSKFAVKNPWFFSFEFDNSNGNFIHINRDDNTFSIFDHRTKKLLKKLSLSEKIPKETAVQFCVTNDGHIVVLKNNTSIEIY